MKPQRYQPDTDEAVMSRIGVAVDDLPSLAFTWAARAAAERGRGLVIAAQASRAVADHLLDEHALATSRVSPSTKRLIVDCLTLFCLGVASVLVLVCAIVGAVDLFGPIFS